MKKWGLLGTGLLIILVAAFSAAVWQYQTLRLNLLAQLRGQLETQQAELSCQQDSRWLIQFHERCQIGYQGKQLDLWLHAWVTPVRLFGRFGVQQESALGRWIAQHNPQFFDDEAGRWHSALFEKILIFSYQTGPLSASLGSEIELDSAALVLHGRLHLIPPFDSRLQLALANLRLEQLGRQLALKELEMELQGQLIDGQFFIPKSRLQLAQLSVQNLGDRLNLRHLTNQQANLREGKRVSSLNELEFDALRFDSPNLSLLVEPSHLQLLLGNVHDEALRLMRQGRYYRAWQSLLKRGFTLEFDRLHTDFAYQDRAPELFALRGNLNAKGRLQWQASDDDLARDHWPHQMRSELWLDASQSLLQGPQAELMMEFLQANWLKIKAGRVHTHLWLENGVLLANDRLVSSQALWPSFQEDH